MSRLSEFSTKLWFPLACTSLGIYFCCSESDRFSTLFTVPQHGNLATTAFLTALILLALILFLCRRMELKLYNRLPLIICIAVACIAKTAILFTPLNLLFSGDFIWAVDKLLFIVETLGFLACGELLMRAGTSKSILAFAIGLIIGGTLQLAVAIMGKSAAVALLFLISAAMAPLLYLAAQGFERSGMFDVRDSLDPHSRPELANSSAQPSSTQGNVPEDKASLLFLLALMLLLPLVFGGIHNQWLSSQDGGTVSSIIQIAAAVGTLFAGNVLIFIRGFLRNKSAFEISENLVPVIAFIALYLSTFSTGSMVFAYIMPLNIAQKAALSLAWMAPFFLKTRFKPFNVLAAGILAYCLGRVLRMFLTAFLQNFPDSASSFAMAAIVVLIITLMCLSFLRLRKMEESELQAAPVPRRRFMDACQELMSSSSMSAREGEVFLILAKGRSAEYIAKRLSISIPTARTHISHVYQKLDVNSQQSLMDMVDAKMLADDEAAR